MNTLKQKQILEIAHNAKQDLLLKIQIALNEEIKRVDKIEGKSMTSIYFALGYIEGLID